MPGSTAGRKRVAPAVAAAVQQEELNLSLWSGSKCKRMAKKNEMLPDNPTGTFTGKGSQRKWQNHLYEACQERYKNFPSNNQPYIDLVDNPWLRAGKFLSIPVFVDAPKAPVSQVEAVVPEAQQPAVLTETLDQLHQNDDNLMVGPNVEEFDPDAFINGVNSFGCVAKGHPVQIGQHVTTKGQNNGDPDIKWYRKDPKRVAEQRTGAKQDGIFQNIIDPDPDATPKTYLDIFWKCGLFKVVNFALVTMNIGNNQDYLEWEIITFLALILLMGMNSVRTTEELFRKEAPLEIDPITDLPFPWQYQDVSPALDAGKYGLCKTRFNEMRRDFCFFDVDDPEKPTTESNEKNWKPVKGKPIVKPWGGVQGAVNVFNSIVAGILLFGWMICLDETMGPWIGHQDHTGVKGPPNVMHIERKPKEDGVEFISAADAWSGILFWLEINFGAYAPCNNMSKKYNDAHPKQISLLKRLADTLPANCEIFGDGAFASVWGAVRLLKDHGIYFIGYCKVCSRSYPMDALKITMEAAQLNHGESICFEAEIEDIRVQAWAIKKGNEKVQYMVGTNGSGVNGTPIRYHNWDPDSNESYTTEYPRTQAQEDATHGQPWVDQHNRIAQFWLGLYQIGTKDWMVCQYFIIFGMMVTNAYRVACGVHSNLKKSGGGKGQYYQFLTHLIVQMLNLAKRKKYQHEHTTPAMAATVTADQMEVDDDTYQASSKEIPVKKRSAAEMYIAGHKSFTTTEECGIMRQVQKDSQSNRRRGKQQRCILCSKRTTHFCRTCGDSCPVCQLHQNFHGIKPRIGLANFKGKRCRPGEERVFHFMTNSMNLTK